MNAKRHQDTTTRFGDDRFVDGSLVDDSLSRTARQLHAAAVANVSATTQAQLHQRRRHALSGKAAATHRGMARPLAWAGAFAVLALAIALPMVMHLPSTPATPVTANTTATTTNTPSGNPDTALATLEEDPEMYVWLTSNDAIALASE